MMARGRMKRFLYSDSTRKIRLVLLPRAAPPPPLSFLYRTHRLLIIPTVYHVTNEVSFFVGRALVYSVFSLFFLLSLLSPPGEWLVIGVIGALEQSIGDSVIRNGYVPYKYLIQDLLK